MFDSRESVVDFMNIMLEHKFFHRAKAIIVKKEIKAKPDNESTDECSKNENKKSEKTKNKEKKKVKLDMHLKQVFVDANEVCFGLKLNIPLFYLLICSALCLDI